MRRETDPSIAQATLEEFSRDPIDPHRIAAVHRLLSDADARDAVEAHLAGLRAKDELQPRERNEALVLANLLGHSGSYRAAALEFDITPALAPAHPVRLVGYSASERVASRILERLSLQLLLLEDPSGTRILLVTADAFGFGDELVTAIQSEARAWGIPPEGVLLNASHTHYAPGAVDHALESLGGYDREYASRLAGLVVHALEPLHAALEPCFVYAGADDVRIGANRRRLVDGEVVMAVNPDGPYYSRTPLLVVDFLESGRTLLLVSHGCHPTGLEGACVVSAGYPGYFRRYLLEHGVADIVMFGQGAGGTAKQVIWEDGVLRFCSSSSDVMHNAALLAEATLEQLNGPLRVVDGPVFARSEVVRLPLSGPPDHAHYARIRDDQGNPLMVREWASYFAGMEPANVPTFTNVPVHLVALGKRAAFVSFGGEPTAELAERLLERLPSLRDVFLLGYTNGLACYLPTQTMLQEGGYECDASIVTYRLPSVLSFECEQRVLDSVTRLLDEWRREDSPNGHGRYELLGFDREAFFGLSTGRCGTATLAALLGHATNARVYHHPRPYLIEETRAAYHGEIDAGATFWRARSGVILDAWKDDLVFGELDHNMTAFAGEIARLLPRSRFVVLVRSPWDFVRSGMRRGYYRGHSWDSGRLVPEPSHSDYGRWGSMSPFEKVCWLWNDTYLRIRATLDSIPDDRYRVVRFEDLVAGASASEELFAFLGLQGFDPDTVLSVLGRRLNSQIDGEYPRPDAWPNADHRTLERACGEMIAYFGYEQPVGHRKRAAVVR